MNYKKLLSIILTMIICIGSVALPSETILSASQWKIEPSLPKSRHLSASETIGDKIYVMGGYEGSNITTENTTYVFDTNTSTWSTVAPKNISAISTASVTVDGKIYCMGGLQNVAYVSTATNQVEIYDPTNNTWTIGTPMPWAVYGASAIYYNSKIYVLGGRTNSGNLVQNILVYDFVTDTWSVGAPLPQGNIFGTAEIFEDNIYIMGGCSNPNASVSSKSVFKYNIMSNTWTNCTPIPVADNINCNSSIIYDNKIYVLGGWDISGNGFCNKVFVYSVFGDTWETDVDDFSQGRIGATANVANGHIYIIGGSSVLTNDAVESLKLQDEDNRLFVLLNVGEQAQLSISYNLPDNTKLTWKSFNPSVATIDINGKITAISEGITYAIATDSNGKFIDYIPVKVIESDAKRLAVHLNVNDKVKLYLTQNPLNVKWTSMSPSIATVSTTGEVTAHSKGLVIIKGELNGKEYYIYVRVAN